MDDDTSPQFFDDMAYLCSFSFIDTLGGQPPVSATTSANRSPIETSSSIPEPDSLALKDDRSHQRARQRLKKPHDISKARRRAPCWCCRPFKEERRKTWDRGLHASFAAAEGESTLEKSIELAKDDNHQIAAAPATRNVSLADLVKAPRKGSDKRFEMVGRPRQVLVLDGFSQSDSAEHDLDEWEHIEVEVKHYKAIAPSYARVVANGA